MRGGWCVGRRRGERSLCQDTGASDDPPVVRCRAFVTGEDTPTATGLVELARCEEKIWAQGVRRSETLVAPIRLVQQSPTRGDGVPQGIEKGTLEAYRYLEHGAFYAVGALAFLMMLGTIVAVPEAVTGLIGAGFIGLSLWSSIRARDGEASGEAAG